MGRTRACPLAEFADPGAFLPEKDHYALWNPPIALLCGSRYHQPRNPRPRADIKAEEGQPIAYTHFKVALAVLFAVSVLVLSRGEGQEKPDEAAHNTEFATASGVKQRSGTTTPFRAVIRT